MRGESLVHRSDAHVWLGEDAVPDVVVVGAEDDVTVAYAREKLRQVARATGRPIGRAEVLIAPIDIDGGVIVDLTIEVAGRAVRARVAAGSAMSALDRFESQLRRQLASDEPIDAAVATV